MPSVEISASLQGQQAVVAGLQGIQTQLSDMGTKGAQQMEQLNGKVGGLSRAFESLGPIIKGAAVGLAAFASTAAIAFMARANADVNRLAGELDDMSKKLGIGTEALQELAAAGMDSGVTLQDFGSVLSRMSALAGKQKDDLDGAAGAFQKYGIEVRDANGNLRDAMSIFNDVADLIQNTDNNTQRLTIASELLGREMGAKLIPVLRDGSQGLRDNAEEARKLGLVLSDDIIKAADESADALEKWSTRIRNYFVVGEVEALKFLGIIERTRKEQINTELSGLGKQRQDIVDFIDRAGAAGEIGTVNTLYEQLADVETKIRQLNVEFDELGKPITIPVIVETGNGTPGGGGLGGGSGGGKLPKGGNAEMPAELKAKIASMRPIVLEQVQAWEAYSKSLQSFADNGIESIMGPMEQLAELQERLNEAVEAGMLDQQQASKIYKLQADRLKDVGDSSRNMLSGLQGPLQGFADQTLTALLDVQAGWDGFNAKMEDVAKKFAVEMIKMIALQLIFKAISGALGGGLGGMGAFAASPAAFWAGGTPQVGGLAGLFQTGGDRVFNRPSLIAVGETGNPERVQVTPLANGGAMDRGGGSGGITIDARGSNGSKELERAVQRAIRRAAPGLIESAVTVVQARNRKDASYLGS